MTRGVVRNAGVIDGAPRGNEVRKLATIDPRLCLLSGLALLGAPPAIVGVSAIGLPVAAAGIVVVAVAALAIARFWRRLPEGVADPMRGRRPLLVLWIVLVLTAAFYTARLSVFMHDEARADLSVLPDRPFFRTHACLSAYTEASRLALLGEHVYDPAAYVDRKIGRLEVDLFQYPPAFLVLGGVLRAGSEDFTVNRAVWFLVQSLALLAVALALALWVGGVAGARLAWLIPLLWMATPTLLTLQLGNFQISAVAWSVGAMLLAAGGAVIPAGAVLGFVAAGKVFPGVLALYLLARRRWGAVLSIAAWAAIWLLLAIAWFGMKPQWDFVFYQAPRIQSGEAFFWVDEPDMAAVSHSIYGLVVRLRELGVPGATRQVGNVVASAYGAGVLAIAVYLGWRRRQVTGANAATRAEEAALWLALLNLGSLRSPFVPDAYAYFGSLWLALLVWSSLRRPTVMATALFVGLLIGFTRSFDGVLPVGSSTPLSMIVVTLVIQVAALAFNGWVLWRAMPRGG